MQRFFGNAGVSHRLTRLRNPINLCICTYDNEALIDLVALVVDKTFTNFVGRLASVPTDFPVVPTLEPA